MMSRGTRLCRRLQRFTVIVLVMSLAGLLGTVPSAEAQKVWNPGAFTLEATGGEVGIGDTIFDLTPTGPQCSDGIDNEGDDLGTPDGLIDFPADPECTSPDDDSELVSGYQPYEETSIGGTIDGDGNVVMPAGQTNFGTVFLDGGVAGIIEVTILATADGAGTLNPLTGDAEVNVHLRVDLDSSALGDCTIGTPADPIDATLTTGTTDPPLPNEPITGVPYDPNTGTATVVDNSFAVPGASSCGPFGMFNGAVNDVLGLPSSAGGNAAILEGAIAPIIEKGVNAEVETTYKVYKCSPAYLCWLSSPIMALVTFDGSGSTAVAGIVSWDWDFGDGRTRSGEVVSHWYRPGRYAATLTVTDTDGDSDVATVDVVVPGPTTSTCTHRFPCR